MTDFPDIIRSPLSQSFTHDGLTVRVEIYKIQGTDGEFKCAHLAMEIMGGAGYTMAHDIQRLFRDTRVGSIGGGTNDIQRNTIAKMMGL